MGTVVLGVVISAVRRTSVRAVVGEELFAERRQEKVSPM